MFGSKLLHLFNPKGIKIIQQSIRDLRRSSNFKRPQIDDQFSYIKATYFPNGAKLNNDNWQNVREIIIKSGRYISETNLDATIIGMCSAAGDLGLAKSYIEYLKSNGKEPNDATIGKLLRTYNAKYHARGGANDSLSKEEQEEILVIYHRLRAKHEVLDSLSCENLICGLVATENWKDSLKLLEMMKISVSAPSLTAFTEIIIKSFANNELQLGWNLMKEMLEEGKQPKCEIFSTLIDTIINRNKKNFFNEMEKLFQFLQTHNILTTQKFATVLQDIALKYPDLLVVTSSILSSFGKCSSCGLHMNTVTVSEEQFKMLQNSFLDKVIIRKDVFQKSTPQEVKEFCNYIERTGPYDCVIDGLNVAYSMGTKKSSEQLASLLESVVKYFTKQNKHVLVLGRQHMNRWPKRTMQYIRNNAAVFLANNLSQDDPFLLYATLKSGQSTDFFSRDLMRQHAFLLGPELKFIFRRWQQEHQYSLVTKTESGKIIVKEPIRHLICAQKVNDTWHVPYKKEFSPNITENFEKPEKWLCIKIKK